MPRCYLTIDDSPTPHTYALCDFLTERDIPALLFIRGDMVSTYGIDALVNAVKNGFVLGNHSMTHRPFGELSVEDCIIEIERTELIINDIYQKAEIKRPPKYFRFPYLDRGNGDRIERHFETVSDVDINDHPKVKVIQSYLNRNGFYQPFICNHPLYKNDSIRNAADCLMTYTSFDWMMLDRHIGKWPYKTLNDLKTKIDDDKWLNDEDSRSIIIMHDKPEPEFPPIFESLIDHMVIKGYQFLPIL